MNSHLPSSIWFRGMLFAVAGPLLATQAMAQYTNPIIPNGGDPFAFQWGGQYFYTRTNGANVAVSRSPWLTSLNTNSQIVWTPPAGSEYSQNVWAPEVHRIDGKWYVYVTASGPNTTHRMYVLEGDSQDPQGSYTFKGAITPDNMWSIDGTVMSQNGKNYFIWSSPSVNAPPGNALYIEQMTNPWTLTGTPVEFSDATNAWEQHGPFPIAGPSPINEGPEVLRHGTDTFMTYSASDSRGAYYAIGALKLNAPDADPLLPSSWTKLPGPLFQQGNGVYATGHASYVKSPDGTEDWIVYHARTDQYDINFPRDVRTQKFTWNTDGTPNFGSPLPTGQVAASPSGQPTVTFIPNLSFERGGAGWLDDFHASGNVGAVANDGSQFSVLTDGDGPHVGYIGADGNSRMWQDLGPLTRNAYTLSVGLAISDDQAQAALQSPGQFVLKLIGIGMYPGGSANESDQVLLAQQTIDSSELAVSQFRYFDVTASNISSSLIGDWLRVELTSSSGSGGWQAKTDLMTLSLPAYAQAIPEPASLMLLGGAMAFGMMRRRRDARDG